MAGERRGPGDPNFTLNKDGAGTLASKLVSNLEQVINEDFGLYTDETVARVRRFIDRSTEASRQHVGYGLNLKKPDDWQLYYRIHPHLQGKTGEKLLHDHIYGGRLFYKALQKWINRESRNPDGSRNLIKYITRFNYVMGLQFSSPESFPDQINESAERLVRWIRGEIPFDDVKGEIIRANEIIKSGEALELIEPSKRRAMVGVIDNNSDIFHWETRDHRHSTLSAHRDELYEWIEFKDDRHETVSSLKIDRETLEKVAHWQGPQIQRWIDFINGRLGKDQLSPLERKIENLSWRGNLNYMKNVGLFSYNENTLMLSLYECKGIQIGETVRIFPSSDNEYYREVQVWRKNGKNPVGIFGLDRESMTFHLIDESESARLKILTPLGIEQEVLPFVVRGEIRTKKLYEQNPYILRDIGYVYPGGWKKLKENFLSAYSREQVNMVTRRKVEAVSSEEADELLRSLEEEK